MNRDHVRDGVARSGNLAKLAFIAFLISSMQVLSACNALVGLDELELAGEGGAHGVDASSRNAREPYGQEAGGPTATPASSSPDATDVADSGNAREGDADGSTTLGSPDADNDASEADASAEAEAKDAEITALDAGLDAPPDVTGTVEFDAGEDFCAITGTCACEGDGDCRDGFKCCGGRCADVANDTEHCGVCDIACSDGRVCEQGTCGCGGLDPFCSSVCVDYFSDGQNCGRCGHSCFGGECIGGACQPLLLASEQESPAAVAVDRFNVFFTNEKGNSIGRVSKSGPECVGTGCITFTDPSICEPYGIAADATNVYVASYANGGPGAIVQIDSALTTATVLANVVAPWGIATANGRVYWTSRKDVTAVGWVPVNGGPIFPVVSNPNGDIDVRAVATDGVSVLWGVKQPRNSGLGSISGPHPLGAIYHLSTSGSCNGPGCTPIMTGAGVPNNFFIAGQWVYWTSTDGTIRKMAKTGGCQGISPCPILLARSQPDPQFLVVDDDEVYWTNAGDGTVRHSSVYRACNGVRCQAIAGGLGAVSGLTQDSTSLYFTSKAHGPGPSGAIYRLAK